MSIFKVGDKVRCVWNDNGTNEYIGEEGKIINVHISDKYPYTVDFSSCDFKAEELELISNKNIIMNLVEKFQIALKSEPEKSFLKADIIDSSGVLTSDGQKVFFSWLLKKYGEDFKKEIVDDLLKEDKKD